MTSNGMVLPREGWQSQAKRLAQTHGAVGTAARSLAERAPQPPEGDVGREAEGLLATAHRTNSRMRRLGNRPLAQQDYLNELEDEVAALREALAGRDSDNALLQASLDSVVRDNTGLKRLLGESSTALHAARGQIRQYAKALDAMTQERDQRQTQLDELGVLRWKDEDASRMALQALVTRAANAETLLAQTEKSLAETAGKHVAAETKLAQMADACGEADDKIQILQASMKTLGDRLNEAQRDTLAREASRSALESKLGALTILHEEQGATLKGVQKSLYLREQEVRQLSQERATMADATTELLETLKAKAAALDAVMEEVERLTERLAEVETQKAKNGARVEELERQAASDRQDRAALMSLTKKMNTHYSELRQRLEADTQASEELDRDIAETPVHSLLSGTLSF